jgi:hypothetical protein
MYSTDFNSPVPFTSVSRGLIVGHGQVDLWSEEGFAAHLDGDPLARVGDLTHLEFKNLITQIGDQYYGERAAGIASPPAQVTGMQLGTGSTAVAKTGAGAAVVTYVSGSNVAIDASWPTSALSGSSRRIQWKTTWAAGVATANNIAEVVLINQNIATNSGAAAAATISRALLSPTVNKGASDTLAVTWNHDLLGA